MAASLHANRWPGYLQEIFRVTRPGGWCQMVESMLKYALLFPSLKEPKGSGLFREGFEAYLPGTSVSADRVLLHFP